MVSPISASVTAPVAAPVSAVRPAASPLLPIDNFVEDNYPPQPNRLFGVDEEAQDHLRAELLGISMKEDHLTARRNLCWSEMQKASEGLEQPNVAVFPEGCLVEVQTTQAARAVRTPSASPRPLEGKAANCATNRPFRATAVSGLRQVAAP